MDLLRHRNRRYRGGLDGYTYNEKAVLDSNRSCNTMSQGPFVFARRMTVTLIVGLWVAASVFVVWWALATAWLKRWESRREAQEQARIEAEFAEDYPELTPI